MIALAFLDLAMLLLFAGITLWMLAPLWQQPTTDISSTEEQPTCTIYWYGDDAHDGPGWYYVDDEYPEEGSVGSFLTWQGAADHATKADYARPTAAIEQIKEKHRYMEQRAPAEWIEIYNAKHPGTMHALEHLEPEPEA